MISGMHTFQVLDSLALLPSPYFEVVLHMHCEYPANTAQQAKASAVPIGYPFPCSANQQHRCSAMTGCPC